MLVVDACILRAHTLDHQADLEEVARALEVSAGEALVIVRWRGRQAIPLGMVGPAEVVRVLAAAGSASLRLRAVDLVPPNAVCLRAASRIDEALRQLGEEGIDRAPVVDPDDVLVGWVSASQLLDALLSQPRRHWHQREWTTLAAEPRLPPTPVVTALSTRGAAEARGAPAAASTAEPAPVSYEAGEGGHALAAEPRAAYVRLGAPPKPHRSGAAGPRGGPRA